MNSYPSSGSSLPSRMARPSNFPSNQVSLVPQNGPIQPAYPAPMSMPVPQGSHQVFPGTVTISDVQGAQVHHHHHHFYPQIGFEQMRNYAYHAQQAQAYLQWQQQMAAIQSAQIFGPHPFQPFPTTPINTAPHMNPSHHQRTKRREYVKPFNKDQVKILKEHFAKSSRIDRKEIEKLAPIVGLTPAQIRHWFSQARGRVRKYGEKKKEEEEKEKVEVVVKKEIIVVKIECDSD
ncbi:unnamed protein product [Caenorhabditis nigoni]